MVKVERSFPASASLAAEAEKDSGNYSGADVIEHLMKDFNNKCYICEMNVSVTAFDLSDREAVLAANLVDEVFNKRNTSMRVYKSEMRFKKLQSEMNVLYTKLEMYKKNPNSNAVKRVLRALLRRESEFAAFKRCYVRNHMDKFPGLEEYIA